MKISLSQAYLYYRKQCLEQAIVFHNHDEFLVCCEKKVLPELTDDTEPGLNICVVKIKAHDISGYLQTLNANNISFRVIEYVNDKHEHVIPEIDRIIEEKEMDY